MIRIKQQRLSTIRHKEIYFCSAASRYFKEQLNGTAANSAVFILIEYNSPFPAKVTEANIDKEWLKKTQQLAKAHNGKVLLVRNKTSNAESCKITFVDCNKCSYFTISTTADKYTAVDMSALLAADETVWQNDPFFLVCTNGKKDKCCSKFGLPVYKFFESFNTDVPVWESSHVGGDRFAANVVAMPYGIYYGHVAVEDVGHILVRTLLKKIYKNNYRGLSRRSFFEQSIECYVRDHLRNYDIDFDIHIHLIEHLDDYYKVEIKAGAHSTFIMELTRETIAYPHLLTCTSTKPENIKKFHLKSLQQVS